MVSKCIQLFHTKTILCQPRGHSTGKETTGAKPMIGAKATERCQLFVTQPFICHTPLQPMLQRIRIASNLMWTQEKGMYSPVFGANNIMQFKLFCYSNYSAIPTMFRLQSNCTTLQSKNNDAHNRLFMSRLEAITNQEIL